MTTQATVSESGSDDEGLPLFFKHYRKRGFSLSMETLDTFPDRQAREPDFFNALKKCGSYLNEFYRVKDALLNHGLVAYKLDENYDKVIYLTDLGTEILERTAELDELMRQGREAEEKRRANL